MRKNLILIALVLVSLVQPVFAQEEEEVAPGAIAAFAAKSTTSDFQNWMFALGTLFSAAAGILLVSWDPGASAPSH